MNKRCPACGADPMTLFYSVDRVPVHSVLLLRSREEAVSFPQGEIHLCHCPSCGFISNLSFNPALQDYSAEYESTQAYSATFNAFSRRLAQQLVDRYDLRGKKVIEIGCGQGEFLSQICEIGQNRGLGFDPAYDPSRPGVSAEGDVQVIADYYSQKYTAEGADFILCKMTLEHIRDVAEFVDVVRESIGSQPDTTVFFQVPDMQRIFKETAFWDIYYEHCSYFSMGSLARLFRAHRYEVRDLWRDYDDQYLMIDAVPVEQNTTAHLPQEDDLSSIAQMAQAFAQNATSAISGYKQRIQESAAQSKKVVLWGSGSKGVAFLTTLGICDEIEYTVDINPNKENTYMAGTGQQVVLPSFLEGYKPDLVILMNPVYQQEVQADLASRGLFPEILPVG
jgi:hypothetical protein